MDKTLKRLLPYILLLGLSYWSIKPLLLPGFFPVHDDTQVARVYEMKTALSQGQFPVRWVPNLGYGYGYPLFNFYAPLPYYFAGLLSLLGISIVTSTKLMFLFPTILATFAAYLFSRELYGKWGGMLSGVLYAYAPYKALDIYVRGAVGEIWVLALLPLFFLSIYKILTGNKVFWFYASLLSFVAIILSHNISAMIIAIGFALFIIIYSVQALLKKDFTRIRELIFIFTLSLGLSAFFWLPALGEEPYTSVQLLTQGGSVYSDHFVYLDQLWDAPWGFGGSAPGRADGLSFKLGKLLILSSLISIILFFAKPTIYGKKRNVYFLCIVIAIIALGMSLEISQPVWTLLPFLAFVQFPWRFLLFLTFSLPIISGYLLTQKIWLNRLIFMVLTILTIVYNSKYFAPQFQQVFAEKQYISEQELQWRISKVSDEYLPFDFIRPSQKEIRSRNTIVGNFDSIDRENIKTTNWEIHAISSQPQRVRLYLTNFPGWIVYVNGKKTDIKADQGRISFMVPQGKVDMKATFTNTFIRSMANALSLFSLIIVIILYGKKTITH